MVAVWWYHRDDIEKKMISSAVIRRFGVSIVQFTLLVFVMSHLVSYLRIEWRMQAMELVFWLWLCCVVPVLLWWWLRGLSFVTFIQDAAFYGLVFGIIGWLL
jgi:hypothetical protein